MSFLFSRKLPAPSISGNRLAGAATKLVVADALVKCQDIVREHERPLQSSTKSRSIRKTHPATS